MARIMIIDDDEDIIESLTLILEAHGHEVVARTDTERVVEAVKEVSPDLILLDVIFPEDPQAGFAAARALHRDRDVAGIPVVILSAVNQRSRLAFNFSDSDISEDFMPVRAFLEKPIEPRALVDKVDSILNAERRVSAERAE